MKVDYGLLNWERIQVNAVGNVSDFVQYGYLNGFPYREKKRDVGKAEIKECGPDYAGWQSHNRGSEDERQEWTDRQPVADRPGRCPSEEEHAPLSCRKDVDALYNLWAEGRPIIAKIIEHGERRHQEYPSSQRSGFVNQPDRQQYHYTSIEEHYGRPVPYRLVDSWNRPYLQNTGEGPR